MSLDNVGRWRAVTVLAATLIVGAVGVGLATPLAIDHVWILVVLAVSAAVARALGSGGGRSVLAAGGAVLVTQPGLHLVGELTYDHAGPAGLVLLACHIALTVALVGMLGAGETAYRALVAGLRRLARVLIWRSTTVPAVPGTPTLDYAPELSHQQRDRAPQPPRRGPPIRPLSLA